MPRVLNARNGYPNDEQHVYIGRPSKWGNPFVIGRDGDREEVIRKYKLWVLNSGLDILELRGKNLVCWCAPKACHGDVLLELANQIEEWEEI